MKTLIAAVVATLMLASGSLAAPGGSSDFYPAGHGSVYCDWPGERLVKTVLANLIVLAVLGGHAHANSQLGKSLFAIPAYVSNHVADEGFGDEFRRWNN